jgi:hypothetical protein
MYFVFTVLVCSKSVPFIVIDFVWNTEIFIPYNWLIISFIPGEDSLQRYSR